MRIILASGSPRRRELLEMLNVKDFEIIPAIGEEVMDARLSPEELVKKLSHDKAAEVAAQNRDALVIGADTVVSLEGTVLGKPEDEAAAIKMLKMLSGKTHKVFTGVTICCGDKVLSEVEETSVSFLPLTGEEICAYVKTGEPMDKAGAYGAQGIGGLFVSRIEGNFFNVMGLPISRLYLMLKKLGVNLI